MSLIQEALKRQMAEAGNTGNAPAENTKEPEAVKIPASKKEAATKETLTPATVPEKIAEPSPQQKENEQAQITESAPSLRDKPAPDIMPPASQKQETESEPDVKKDTEPARPQEILPEELLDSTITANGPSEDKAVQDNRSEPKQPEGSVSPVPESFVPEAETDKEHSDSDAETEEKETKEHKSIAVVITVLVAFVVFVFGALYLILTTFSKIRTPPPTPVTIDIPATPPPAVQPETITDDTTETIEETIIDETGVPPVPPEPEPAVDRKPVEEPEDIPPSEAEPAPETVVAVTPPPSLPPQPPPPREPVVWPNISLQGVVGRGTTGSVIIDGEVIGVGEAYNGARVIRIEHQGALMEYKGERRVIRVGR